LETVNHNDVPGGAATRRYLLVTHLHATGVAPDQCTALQAKIQGCLEAADTTARIAEFEIRTLYDIQGGDSLVLYVQAM
jgi:hypothetical protein